MFRQIFLFCFLAVFACAQQTYNLTLPWGIWQSTYDPTTAVYKFSNVRFGAAPVGALRFQGAQFPSTKSTAIQAGSDASCFQIANPQKSKCAAGGANPISPPNSTVPQSEDCLFLDIYVPKKVMESAGKQPPTASVAVWLFGGAYLFGSKNYMLHDGFHTPFYDGSGIVNNSGYNTIFVAGNYRVGAFGWLAGTTMESQGLPNAGLSDQRLLFDWVQQYIGLVGGNNKAISAWGESAGASSILHHLISRDSNGGQLVPKFQRVAIQSPAYQWLYDRTGFLEQTYTNFTCYVCEQVKGSPCCPTSSVQKQPLYNVTELSQLADKNIDWLVQANQALFQNTKSCTGLFPVGPAVDGKVIRNLAAVELAANRFAPLDSILVSHVADEAFSFVKPPFACNDSDYAYILNETFPGDALTGVRNAITTQYPVANYGNNQTLRLKTTIQDAMFLSNNRLLIEAYSRAKTPVWAFQWNGFNGTAVNASWPNFSVHASDLPALFYNNQWDLYGFLKKTYPQFSIDPSFFKMLSKVWNNAVAQPYQIYFTNHAATGSPYPKECDDCHGSCLQCQILEWDAAQPTATGVKNLMTAIVGIPAYEESFDSMLTETMGKFWQNQAQAIMQSVKGVSSEGEAGLDGAQVPLLVDEL